MTLGDMIAEVERLSRQVDEGVRDLAEAAEAVAIAEFNYRKAKAEAWVKIEGGTVAQKQAKIDGLTANHRYARDRAENDKTVAVESLRSKRAQLSAVQTVITAYRAETQLAGFGPNMET